MRVVAASLITVTAATVILLLTTVAGDVDAEGTPTIALEPPGAVTVSRYDASTVTVNGSLYVPDPSVYVYGDVRGSADND